MEITSKFYLSLLIASGALNKEVTLANGNKVILKGTSQKIRHNTEQSNDNGMIDTVKVTESYKTVVYGLNLTHGQFVKYE